MPIYAYKCESCGFAKDVLRKISDVPLSECPSCGASTFRKQVTSAGFQLKGSGWYATDFKGSGAAPAASSEKSADGDKKADSDKKADGEKKGEAKPAQAEAAKPAAAPAAKPDSAASTSTGS